MAHYGHQHIHPYPNDQSGFQGHQSSSVVAQLAGNQPHPQSNYSVGQTHQERQAQQPGVLEWLRRWFQSPSQGSGQQHMIGTESIRMYCEQYDRYGSDDEKRLELIVNMMLKIAEQVSEMKDAVAKSKHLKVLLQEKEILKAELKEANAKVVKLQEQLRGSRTKMVVTAEKRGVLPNKDRAAKEHVIKEYFKQKFPAFTDEYGSGATNARKDLTELFVKCFKCASDYLAQKMADTKRYGTHVPEQLKELDDLNKTFQDVHTVEVWVKSSTNAKFWEQYKAVMELKSTILLHEKNLEDDLKSKLRKEFFNLLENQQYKYLCREKHHGDDVDPYTKPKKKRQPDKPSYSEKKKSAPVISCETPEQGTMSEDNPRAPNALLEGFVTNTIDTIVLMLCLPNPILPSKHLKLFYSEWVTTDVSEEDVRTSQLADKPIIAYYSPILFTASAGTDGYRLFQRGIVRVKHH